MFLVFHSIVKPIPNKCRDIILGLCWFYLLINYKPLIKNKFKTMKQSILWQKIAVIALIAFAFLCSILITS